MNKKVDIFIAGCQKTGSTWLYRCFKEHPQIFVPEKDAIHYFTVNHDLGFDWYHQWYREAAETQIWCDATPSYIRDAEAAKRIFDYNPEAKLIFVLRNPIERAFSHYWHMKRKHLISYSFDDMLFYNGVGNIDLFQMWYYSSQYSHLLEPFLNTFDRSQIHLTLFDDLGNDPETFLTRILDFITVDSTFQPSILKTKVNTGNRGVLKKEKERGLAKRLLLGKKEEAIDEYQLGVSEITRKRLIAKFEKEIDRLSTIMDRDLTHWKK